MNPLKRSLQENVFNKESIYAEIMQTVSQEGLRSRQERGNPFMKKALIGLAFALVLALGVWVLSPNPETATRIAAIVAVDINPSFELSTTEEGVVLEIDALNEDAQSIETSDLLNMEVAFVIDALILRSTEAGFINLEDLEEDYVVVSVVSLDDDEAIQDQIQDKIQAHIKTSESLQSMNVVQIKASQRELFEARGKEVPLGLYVINGMVNVEDEWIQVKDFFKDEDRKNTVLEKVKFTGIGEDQLKARLDAALDKLDKAGEDTTELRQRLENAGQDDLLRIQSEIRNKDEKDQGENKTGDSGNTNTQASDPAGSQGQDNSRKNP